MTDGTSSWGQTHTATEDPNEVILDKGNFTTGNALKVAVLVGTPTGGTCRNRQCCSRPSVATYGARAAVSGTVAMNGI